MLKKIIIDNFKTFTKQTIIDFTATNYKFLEEENVGSNKILKGLLFVGENASGKTGIIMSIKLLLDMLFNNNEINLVINKSFYTKKEVFSLKYYFLIDDKEIIYELMLSTTNIVKEKLEVDNKIIIDRMGNTATFSYNEDKVYTDLSDKLLFLRRIYFDTKFYDDKLLNKWFDFLKNSVYINCSDKTIKTYNGEGLIAHDYINKNGVSKVNEFLKKINYNQVIKYDDNTNNKDGKFNIKSNEKFISFMKEGTETYVSEMFESTGNITLIQLIPSFLHATSNNCLLLLDEFGSGFHNELEECFIKYFNHYASNSQLVFVSHSTNLLNNTILRPDQIYSTSFDSKNGTVLKKFSDQSPREAQNTEKMYLNGVFNGMPRYNKKFKDKL